MIFALTKALLFVGLTLFLGAWVFELFVQRGPLSEPGRQLQLGRWLGTGLLLVVTLIDGALTLRFLRTSLPASQVWGYVNTTPFVPMLALRLSVVPALLLLPRALPPRVYAGLVTTLGVLLLETFSWLGHAGATGRFSAVTIDVLHLASAVAWAGSVLYAALLPWWSDSAAHARSRSLMERVSVIGLLSVIVMSASGASAAFEHFDSSAMLMNTRYGRVFLFKMLLVSNILMIAAMNRWFILPRLRLQPIPQLAHILRLEAALLICVLLTTGLLSTSSLSNDPLPGPQQHIYH